MVYKAESPAHLSHVCFVYRVDSGVFNVVPLVSIPNHRRV